MDSKFDKLSSLSGRENVGLYRSDRLVAINSSSWPKLVKMRENVAALFKNGIKNHWN